MKFYKRFKRWFLYIMCCLGYHDWMMDNYIIFKCNRTCRRCDKSQHSMYDMTYGTTYWENDKNKKTFTGFERNGYW